MGTAEPNKKASIGWSKTEMSEQSGADQNNGNKSRKRCNIITPTITKFNPFSIQLFGYSLCLLNDQWAFDGE
jgi:hypothetical protein